MPANFQLLVKAYLRFFGQPISFLMLQNFRFLKSWLTDTVETGQYWFNLRLYTKTENTTSKFRPNLEKQL